MIAVLRFPTTPLTITVSLMILFGGKHVHSCTLSPAHVFAIRSSVPLVVYLLFHASSVIIQYVYKFVSLSSGFLVSPQRLPDLLPDLWQRKRGACGG